MVGMLTKSMSQDFHQPAFEFFQHVHGSTGPEKLNWVWTDFCPFCSGAAPPGRRAELDGMPTLTLFCWYIQIWENPDVGRPFLLSSGFQMLWQTKRKRDSINAFGYRFTTCSAFACGQWAWLWFLLYYFVNCWSPLLLSISVARITSFHPVFTTPAPQYDKNSFKRGLSYSFESRFTVLFIALLYILHNWCSVIQMNEWYCIMKEKLHGFVSQFWMNKRKSVFFLCARHYKPLTSRTVACPWIKKEKYGNSVSVMYF